MTDIALIASLIGKHHVYQDQEAKELKSSVQFFTIHMQARATMEEKLDDQIQESFLAKHLKRLSSDQTRKYCSTLNLMTQA